MILADFNEDAVHRVARDLAGLGIHDSVACAPKTSVTDWDDLLRLFVFVEKLYSKVDVVVSCAGATEF